MTIIGELLLIAEPLFGVGGCHMFLMETEITIAGLFVGV